VRLRGLLILANSLAASAITIRLATVFVTGEQLFVLALFAIVLNVFAATSATARPRIPFGLYSWILSVVAYILLLVGGFLGGFGRFAPTELIVAPASAVAGALCLGYSRGGIGGKGKGA